MAYSCNFLRRSRHIVRLHLHCMTGLGWHFQDRLNALADRMVLQTVVNYRSSELPPYTSPGGDFMLIGDCTATSRRYRYALTAEHLICTAYGRDSSRCDSQSHLSDR